MAKKLKIRIVKKSSPNDDLKFWLKKTPSERISAVETLREQYYEFIGLTRPPRLVRTIQIRPLHQ